METYICTLGGLDGENMHVLIRTCVFVVYLAVLGTTSVQGFVLGMTLRQQGMRMSLRPKIDYGAGYDPRNRPGIDYGAGFGHQPGPRHVNAQTRPKIDYGAGYDPRNRPSVAVNFPPALHKLHPSEASTLCKGVLVLKICVDFAQDETVPVGRGVEYGMSFYDPDAKQYKSY